MNKIVGHAAGAFPISIAALKHEEENLKITGVFKLTVKALKKVSLIRK